MIGKTLKYMRKQKKLSQVEIAKRLNIKQNTLSRYETETADITFEMIEKIANICGYQIFFENDKEKIRAQDIFRKDV